MSDRKKSLEERLKAHPHLKEHIDRLIEIVEDTSDEITKADEAEQRVIDELKRLGNEILHDWATFKEKAKAEEYSKNEEIKLHGKKKLNGTRHLEK